MIRYTTLTLAIAFVCNAWALSVDVIVLRHSYCGRASGYVISSTTGGVPPYTYAWSDGSTGDQIIGIGPGDHSLTVTDSEGTEATANFTIDLLTSYEGLNGVWSMPHCPEDAALVVVYTGMEAQFQQPPLSSPYGPNPYTFSHPLLTNTTQVTSWCEGTNVPYELLSFSGAAPGWYTIDFADADGCPGQFQALVGPEWGTYPAVQALSVEPSCASTGTGSITYAYEGALPYDYMMRLRPSSVVNECSAEIDVFGVQRYQSSGTRTVSNLLPGDYYLVTTNDGAGVLTNSWLSDHICADSVLITVPSLGIDCGVLSGRVFIDESAECVLDGGENRVPGTIVEILPGPVYATTNSSGGYRVALNFGDYTVTEQNANYDQSCPSAVTLANGAQTFNVGCAGGEPLDVQLAMANGPARPGFELHYAIDLYNLTPASPGVITLTVTLDPALGYISANPAPSSIAGNVLTWTTPQLVMNQVFQHKDINVRTQVPSDVSLIGSTLSTTAQLVCANTDGNLANNTVTSNQLVTGSFDPNDKRATTSLGSSSTWLIDEDEWIDYTIRFQNTGTDTAFNVIITDTLPATLDPSSLTWGAGSHAHSRALIGQGVVKFIFPNILLPDSNANEALSHGFVSFRIRPRQPVPPGTVIENIANIYFDYNPPVITEPSVLVAESSTGVKRQERRAISLAPVPTSDELFVNCGIAMVNVRILAADGREVIRIPARSTQVRIDLNGLNSGAYLIDVELESGNTARERFIKQ